MNGTFPLTYIYRGVLITWSTNIQSVSYCNRVMQFLKAYDIKHATIKETEYKEAVTKICSEQRKYTITAFFDNIDYGEEED